MIKVNKKMCATCPFRKGSELEHVKDLLIHRVLVDKVSPICHSTGEAPIKKPAISTEELACRGARDYIIEILYRLKILPEATDAAWESKSKEEEEKFKSLKLEPKQICL